MEYDDIKNSYRNHDIKGINRNIINMKKNI